MWICWIYQNHHILLGSMGLYNCHIIVSMVPWGMSYIPYDQFDIRLWCHHWVCRVWHRDTIVLWEEICSRSGRWVYVVTTMEKMDIGDMFHEFPKYSHNSNECDWFGVEFGIYPSLQSLSDRVFISIFIPIES